MKKRREIEGGEKQEIERKVDREGMKKRGTWIRLGTQRKRFQVRDMTEMIQSLFST